MPTTLVRTDPARKSLAALREDLVILVNATIAAGFAVARGAVCGLITATGLARRRTHALAAGAGFATNSTTGQVADASVFTPGDVLKNAAGATIGTIAPGGVNTTTNIITLTGNAAVAVAAGAAVLGSDGSQVAKFIADEASDGVGDTPIPAIIGGLLVEADLSGLDGTAKTELGGVSAVAGIFKF
jgi:hypothetical protein